MPAVVLVTSSFLPRFGGVEEHTLNVARQLRDRGHRVVVWAVEQGDDDVPRAVDGIPVRYLPCPLPARSGKAMLHFVAALPAAVARWVAAWRADRPDVLHVQCFGPNGVYAWALSRCARTPLVVSSHGETFMDADGAFESSALLRGALRAALRSADAVTACSAFTAAHLVAGYGLPAGRGQVVPNGIDTQEAGGQAPPWLPVSYVLGVGRLVHNKGFDLLIDAFATLDRDDVRLVIGGDGPELGALRAQVDALGLSGQVLLPGRLSRAEVVAVMAGATALVVPSRIEAFGITILEGWRAGIPVVATRRGGPPEFVADGVTGLLVDPEDRGQIANAIATLLDEPALAARLGTAGRTAVRGYTWADVAARYEGIYREVGAGTAVR
ncbi:glycosyltransferase family 4 protein [Pengzhenrongella frigida]|nr:glycosyltransferase family 4 protein [Cellulomonas sp. HLT2-17]